MKRLLFVLCSAFFGLASAQSVDWNRVRSSCSSEISAYDAVRGTGDTSNQALRFLETDAGSPPSAAKLRALIDRERAKLSDAYLMKTPVFRNSAEMYVCTATAALNQLQTQTAATAPAAASPKGDSRSEASIRGCIKMDPANGSLTNQCTASIYLSWCAVPYRDSTATRQPCESQRFSTHLLSPGEGVRVDEGAEIHWMACPESRRPSDLKYELRTGPTGRCVR